MKNNQTLLTQWQDNQRQMQLLLQQQNQLFTDLLDENSVLQASLQTAGNVFFVKNDYSRIVIEIEAHKRVGHHWPGKWSSMVMLADLLTPIVGWVVLPNSLWCALQNIAKLEQDIRRRAAFLNKKRTFEASSTN